MELRKYGGHVGTSPTTLDCRSLFTKAFFCSNFIPELWSRMAVNLKSNTEAVSIEPIQGTVYKAKCNRFMSQ